MNNAVTHPYDAGQVRKRSPDIRVQFGGEIKRLAQDLKLAFRGRPQHQVAGIVVKGNLSCEQPNCTAGFNSVMNAMLELGGHRVSLWRRRAFVGNMGFGWIEASGDLRGGQKAAPMLPHSPDSDSTALAPPDLRTQ